MKINKGFLFLALIFLFPGCYEEKYFYHEGETMGTFYHIKYYSYNDENYARHIDSILNLVNLTFSTYNPESVVSRFNRSADSAEVTEMFKTVFFKSSEIWLKSAGAFDPTVMPLVNAWGFGFEKINNVDSFLIDSLLNYIGLNQLRLNGNWLIKNKPGIMLDFSAIAKGFGVDCVAEFLESKNVRSYMVEIGGEVRVRGLKPGKEKWRIAIEKPIENLLQSQVYDTVLEITDIAMATSGNYRNFYYKDGVKYAHTINPHTGFPAFNDLLSASVLAKTCMEADAWATAFMVMGMKNSLEILKTEPELAVFFIYNDEHKKEKFYSSKNLRKITGN